MTHPASIHGPYRRHLLAAIASLGLPDEVTLCVSGGRDFGDTYLMAVTLGILSEQVFIRSLLHGDARGADRMARQWAYNRRLSVRSLPAMWKGQGNSAGPIRNAAMVEELLKMLPACVVVAMPGGNGTADMVIRCNQEGIPLIDVADLLDIE